MSRKYKMSKMNFPSLKAKKMNRMHLRSKTIVYFQKINEIMRKGHTLKKQEDVSFK